MTDMKTPDPDPNFEAPPSTVPMPSDAALDWNVIGQGIRLRWQPYPYSEDDERIGVTPQLVCDSVVRHLRKQRYREVITPSDRRLLEMLIEHETQEARDAALRTLPEASVGLLDAEKSVLLAVTYGQRLCETFFPVETYPFLYSPGDGDGGSPMWNPDRWLQSEPVRAYCEAGLRFRAAQRASDQLLERLQNGGDDAPTLTPSPRCDYGEDEQAEPFRDLHEATHEHGGFDDLSRSVSVSEFVVSVVARDAHPREAGNYGYVLNSLYVRSKTLSRIPLVQAAALLDDMGPRDDEFIVDGSIWIYDRDGMREEEFEVALEDLLDADFDPGDVAEIYRFSPDHAGPLESLMHRLTTLLTTLQWPAYCSATPTLCVLGSLRSEIPIDAEIAWSLEALGVDDLPLDTLRLRLNCRVKQGPVDTVYSDVLQVSLPVLCGDDKTASAREMERLIGSLTDFPSRAHRSVGEDVGKAHAAILETYRMVAKRRQERDAEEHGNEVESTEEQIGRLLTELAAAETEEKRVHLGRALEALGHDFDEEEGVPYDSADEILKAVGIEGYDKQNPLLDQIRKAWALRNAARQLGIDTPEELVSAVTAKAED